MPSTGVFNLDDKVPTAVNAPFDTIFIVSYRCHSKYCRCIGVGVGVVIIVFVFVIVALVVANAAAAGTTTNTITIASTIIITTRVKEDDSGTIIPFDDLKRPMPDFIRPFTAPVATTASFTRTVA